MIQDSQRIAIIAGNRQVTYSEVLIRIQQFAQKTPNRKGCKTIILSENREGWVYAFFSAWANNNIAIPVDAGSTVQDIAYIVNDCKPDCIWTSRKKADTVRAAVAEAGVNVDILLIDDYERIPAEGPKAVITSKETDTAVIIYTSGTTGNPKGVMLSFANLEANKHGVVDEVPIFTEDRRTLVLLPVHHILPLQGTIIIPLTVGGGIAICPSLSGPDIMDTLCRGKISIMIGVPRLWQTLYSGIMKKIDGSPITRGLFKLCAAVGSRSLSRFIFQSVHKKMGGHLDYCVSGGAALDREIGEGLRTLGIDMLEGYGMSETAPIIAFTRPGDYIPGCVGLPLPSVECKIINGELCAKGPNVMQGYYNRPEETAAVIDQDGFIHTGDLAVFDEKGRVTITGRSKEIIVLSNGKNVQPNEIEYKLEKYESFVKEAAIIQDGDLLRAIIVPQPAFADGKTDQQLEEILKREVIEPYNLTVANYKKVMSVFVYKGDLPRTKLDKLQRFKLNALIEKADTPQEKAATYAEPSYPEYQILKKYLMAEKKMEVRPDSHLETDLAMDSLDKVNLQGFIENSFGLTIKVEQMATFKSVEELAGHIQDYKTRIEVEDTDWKHQLEKSTSHLELPQTSWTYAALAKTFKCYFKLYNNLTVKGLENVPAKGPFIMAPNHQSFLDGPLVVAGLPKSVINQCYFYATEEHVRNAFAKSFARHNNIILMERKNLKDSIFKLGEVLKEGKSIVIFPEGRRTHTGKVGEFKKTFAILSRELNVPIIPVVIKGAFESLPRTKSMPNSHPISVEYLPAVQPFSNQNYEEIAKEVKQAIEARL